VIELRLTPQFVKWFSGLRDERAQARIQVRLDRLQSGLLGEVKPVGEGVSEMKIDYGPGYRVYFCQRGSVLTIVLAGGNKKTQQRDIQVALEMARNL
jgi:putative addiction module killer protein